MLSGICYILAACLCWALVFIAPALSPDFSPLEIIFSRFFFFGIASLAYLAGKKKYLLQKPYRDFWGKALFFGLMSTLVCYGCIVFGIYYSNATLSTLLFGLSPLTISLYGNRKRKEYASKSLIPPLLFVALGFFCIHFYPLLVQNSAAELEVSAKTVIGILFSLISLSSWTWFAVANHQFLQKNTTISSSDWITMMGCSLLPVILCLSSCLFFLYPEVLKKYFLFSFDIQIFLLESALLGIVSSWVAFIFWNKGNLKLPITLAGQLSVFEMLFAIIYIFLLEKRAPLFCEILGISLILMGLFVFFRLARKDLIKLSQ